MTTLIDTNFVVYFALMCARYFRREIFSGQIAHLIAHVREKKRGYKEYEALVDRFESVGKEGKEIVFSYDKVRKIILRICKITYFKKP